MTSSYHGERRRRFLPINTEVKEDLQEIFASTESAYSEIRDVYKLTEGVEKSLEKLQEMLSEYSKDTASNDEDSGDKLDQIIQFCSDISDAFERLVETVSTESASQIEEVRQNRSILTGIAGTYKTIHNQIIGIKASLDEAAADRKNASVIIKDVIAKIDLLNVALQAQAPIVLFFKNMKHDDIPKLLPNIQIAVAESLKDHGYTSSGEKKEPIIIILNLILTQIRNNFLSIVASAIVMWIINSWMVVHKNMIRDEVPSKVEIEDLKNKIVVLEELNKKMQKEANSRKQPASSK